MKTFWSKVPLILTLLLAGLLLCYTVGMTLAPEQTTKAIGYRPYIILTDSMDPVIPPGSLVITKTYQAGQALTPGEIITFRVHVFGEEIFTHYFRGMETLPDGSPWYRTQGAKSEYYDGPEDYDDYPTKEEDILGVCVVHLPYVGAIIKNFSLYIQSPFGWLNIALCVLIYCIYHFLLLFFDTKDYFSQKEREGKKPIKMKALEFGHGFRTTYVKGKLKNKNQEAISGLSLHITLLGKDETVYAQTILPIGTLEKNQKFPWNYTIEKNKKIKAYRITLS